MRLAGQLEIHAHMSHVEMSFRTAKHRVPVRAEPMFQVVTPPDRRTGKTGRRRGSATPRGTAMRW